MAQVLLEDKNKVVEIPDGLTPQEMEKQLRSFYTPEELYGATTFEEREGYRIRRGRATVDDGKAFYRAMAGEISIDDARRVSSDVMAEFTPENDEKYSAHNWLERVAGATTELAPYMMDSTVHGVLYGESMGMAAATAALALGQAGPQIAFPEEIITVPGAYIAGKAVGQTFGTWLNAAQVEGGGVYKSLLEDGHGHEVARNWALPAGYLIGAIELLQIKLFIPGFGRKGITNLIKKVVRKEGTNLAKTIGKTSLRLGKELAITTAKEISQEEVQELIGITAEVGAAVFKDMEDEEGYIGPDYEEAKMRLEETLKQGLWGFPLLGLPASIHTTMSIHGREKFAQRVMTQRGQEALNFDLADRIAEATKFDKVEDFQQSLGEDVDDKYANQFGFDNRTLFAEAVWNASRDVKGEDKIIEELAKGEVKPVKEVVGKPPTEGGKVEPELQSLAEEARKHKSADEFREAVNQRHLMDLSNPEVHNWGRAFASYPDEPLTDISQIIKDKDGAGSYLSTMKYSNPVEYKAINSPSDTITVYRAVPEGVGDKIRIGDYVALDKKYAQMHLDSVLQGEQKTKGKIISLTVPKKDIVWGEADFTEWAYSPQKFRQEYTTLTDFYNKVKLPPTERGGVAKEKSKPSKLISKEQTKGRINKLIEDSNDVLKQIDSLERQKARLEKAGKPVVALGTEIAKLASQYNNMDSQIAEIMTSEGVQLYEEKIQLKARELEAIEKKIKQTAKAEERATQKTLQKEKSAKIAEIKQMLVDYASENLPASERGAFLNAVMNIKTKKQLDKQIARVNEYAEKAEKRGLVRQIKQQIKRIAKSKSISIDYVQKIQDFINDYELKGHNEDTVKKLQKTKDFIEKERLAGRNVEMPSYVLDALEVLARKPLTELSSADLQNISDKIEVMADLGKTKLRSRRTAQKLLQARDLQAIAKDAKAVNSRKIKEGNVISGKLNTIDNFLNGVKKALNFAQMKDLVLTPMDAVFDLLDGAKGYKGANYRIFKRRVDVAYSLYLQAKFDITQRVDSKANELKLDNDNMERIGLYAAKVQKGGMEKLLSFFTEKQIGSVVLTDNEMEFYNFMRKELDALRPQIEKVMREVYNKPLGEVENYFPFMTDFDAMSDKEIRDRFGDSVITHYDTLKKNVEMGFTEKRVGGKNRIKLNAAEIFGSHIDNATYLINVGKETKYLGELAKTDEYGRAAGDVGQEIVREWIDFVARKGQTQSDRIKLLDIARNYTGMVALGFKLSSTLVQITSLMDGAALIGPHAFSGFKNIVSDSEWRAFVIDNMPELRNRVGDDPAFQDFKKEGFTKKLNDIAYAPLKTVDKFVACGVAAGAYAKYCEDNDIAIDLNNPNPDAIEYAQKMMRRTQSSSQFKDLPLAISKGKLTGNVSLDKIILQFQSFMLNRWSLIRHDLWRAGIRGTNKKQAINIAIWLIAANFAELGIRKWTKEMIAALTGEELPEEDEDKDFIKNLGQILQNIPFIGSLYYAVLYRGLPVPSADMARKILEKFGTAIKKTTEEDGDDGEVLKAWEDFIINSVPGGQQFSGVLKEE